MASKSKNLRSGFTTGACAAAAAKGACLLLVSGTIPADQNTGRQQVSIPFPDGTRHTFALAASRLECREDGAYGYASVIKDAGDDPDVTHGAEIAATIRLLTDLSVSRISNRVMPAITIKGGDGVGIVTRPGLQVRVGDPAINPMPRQMIRMAVAEALQGVTESLPGNVLRVEVTISIPEGRIIARKTLNERLGIIGGLSVLGTTGIVRPISTEAWTATITASMNVAEAMGRNEIVLSSGRSSERAHMTQYGLPSEAYVMMGDYVEYSLLETRKHGFGRIHLCAQWAKMLKAAMAIPHTHAKHGAIDPVKAIAFLRELGYDGSGDQGFNTTRQIFEAIASAEEAASALLFSSVCRKARTYAESITDGIPVVAHLVSYQGRIVSHDG